ncbi:ADL105Cp [Eremothecium gossypii ATCC 10895]|uniref:ADL105Cp n=1 Tax=Eremothecium gossypii (strain ATCC 10895 / CBS 109.51 / FGSC 9923 / NRRL Y-1056) TaxID=284811 RepID=Q75B06_EREGS|nr:ADL105Cp [Eremothecium gossypii ATCC 10895]AAS51815.2 ADL105Cp [Eremothecium gossypii ATCC 10895]
MSSAGSRAQAERAKGRSACELQGVSEHIIVENQRGITLFGYPFFSNKLLIPKVDPPQFHTEKEQQPISTTTSNYYGNTNNKLLLPLHFRYTGTLGAEGTGRLRGRPASGGSDDEFAWFVSMDYRGQYDIDDQGWCYSWSFRSKYWKGKSGFVRKRFWVRLPTRSEHLGQTSGPGARAGSRGARSAMHRTGSAGRAGWAAARHTEPQSPIAEEDDEKRDEDRADTACMLGSYTRQEFSALYEGGNGRFAEELAQLVRKIDKLPLDRQKFEALEEFVQGMTPTQHRDMCRIVRDPNSGFTGKILSSFQFDVSRRKFLERWIHGLLMDTGQTESQTTTQKMGRTPANQRQRGSTQQ